MARHTVEYDELNGYVVETSLASTSATVGCDSKELTVMTTIAETPTVIYRVYNRTKRVHFDYDAYGDALQAYNWM